MKIYSSAYYKAYYQKHKEHLRAKQRRYHANNRAKERAKRKVRARKDKVAALNHYGGLRCICCGESHIVFLTLDHVNQDGALKRREHGMGSHFYSWLRRKGYPQLALQVMCYNCNCGRYRNDGVCPHQETVTTSPNGAFHLASP